MADEETKAPPAKGPADWICERVAGLLGAKKAIEKFKKSYNEDPEKSTELFVKGTVDYLIFIPAGDGVTILRSAPHPDKIRKKAILCVNQGEKGESLTLDDVRDKLIFSELSGNVLKSMLGVCQDVFLPVLSNRDNQQGWSDLVSKDLIENKFHQFLSNIQVTIGEVDGRTKLPVPPSESQSSERISSKDKAHVFEGAVITWTKQIRNVLKQDPETVLKSGQDPNPLVEIDFWKNKAENLNSIHGQLHTERIRRVLKFLEQNKSTYTSQFHKLEKDVQAARIEANDNFKFLRTLDKYFGALTDDTTEYKEIEEAFTPIMHTILLIWNYSQYYNTPARLVVLIREICNAIITQSVAYLGGSDIFNYITNEEPGVASVMVKTILHICQTFKETYFTYKSKAGTSKTNNTWKITPNALFVRLDAFMERCQDIQHLTDTIVQFSKLQKIEIGGTKGKTLTSSVKQIYVEFEEAVKEFCSVEYDVMDVARKEFDDDFYSFRCHIKELERRLGSVLTQGFDDCDTIYGRFKLLDTFEGLLTRPIIQDELEKKHIILLESYKTDLKTVQQLFLDSKILVDTGDEKAPISKNMPPVTGAFNWTRGLQDRIKDPMEKLSNLNQAVLEREEYKDVQKLYTSLIRSFNEYQTAKIHEWESEVEESCKDKLKEHLLTRDDEDLLKVNFDAALVRLLKEVKYFQLIDMPVPQSAQEIFAKNEVYRNWTGNLDLIIGMYNNIKTTLLDVEKPLLDDRIQKMDKMLLPGVNQLIWRSPNINDFIHESLTTVKDVNTTVTTMQDNLKQIEEKMAKWAEKPLIERKPKPLPPEDFDQAHKAAIQVRHQEIVAGGRDINKLMKETGDVLKNAKGTPHWEAYVDYVNGIVIEGLATVIKGSLGYLGETIDAQIIKKTDAMPIFDIRIELDEALQRVSYDPEVEENARGSSIRDVVHSWITDFLQLTNLVARIDGASGDYLNEIRDHMVVQFGISNIENHLNFIQDETNKFKDLFQEYSYLWTEDLDSVFAEFLETETVIEQAGEGEEGEEGVSGGITEEVANHPIFKGVAIRMPELSLFDEKITQLKAIQQKIQAVANSTDIFWLRVNVNPLKQALDLRIGKWINKYTHFLLNNVTGSMDNMSKFIDTVANGIAIEEDDDIQKGQLMTIMTHISDVRIIQDIADNMFLPLRDQVSTMKKHQVEMQADIMNKVEDLKTRWEDLKLKVNNVKAIILPIQTVEIKSIKEDLEKFEEEVGGFRQEFQQTLPFNFEESTEEIIDVAYSNVDEMYQKLLVVEEKAKERNDMNQLFELDKRQYRPLKECRSELILLKILWDSIACIHNQYSDAKNTLWDKIDTEYLLEQNKQLDTMVKTLPKELRVWKGFGTLQDKVKNMSTVLPLINDLHNPCMEKRHWKQLTQLTGKTIEQDSPTFCLDNLLALKLHKFADEVEEIVDQAQKEATIEKKLAGIEVSWDDCRLEFETFKDCPIILPLDETIEKLELDSMDLMSMQSQGKYVEYFKDRVDKWLNTLKKVDSVIQVWIKVQRNWKRLESIFLSSEDIRSQLPDDTKLFEQIDNEFREIMNDASENSMVVEATCQEGREEALQELHSNIEKCEKALNDYLEQKKKAFPRFYFVSNQALLDILSNGNNPHKVAEYFGDCFVSLNALEFEKDETGKLLMSSTGMFSKEGEYVKFPDTCNEGKFVCKGAVESWLCDLESMMKAVLKGTLDICHKSSENLDLVGEKSRDQWIEEYPAQVALTATCIVWTEEVHRAIDEVFEGSETAMKEYGKVCSERINKLIDRVVMPNVTAELRDKFITIITVDVHSRDVVDKLALAKVSEKEAFLWQCQLKFYWGPDETGRDYDCSIKICDWTTPYSYEYIGNCGRLVITPLTDRCYITLTQALNLMMGGAPAGPAGTGKTETVKDLSRAIALQVVVFNCSEQMNYQTMAQVFMGLSQSGAWGCFDEFNRISIEVLSVVSTQVRICLEAKKAGKTKFMFYEEELVLVFSAGYFITMNPGYAGRTELPESLKALFRSCAMVVPDIILICENMLMSEGFKSSRLLANKFMTLYELSKELLSKAKHYDWGLRAVKSVLRMAGKLRRADPEIEEDPLLMRALRDFNTPKITTNDKPIFLQLIDDLFPGIEIEKKLNPELVKQLRIVTKENKLQPEDVFIEKCVNLSEILEVRHSVFIIGPPGSGKTEVWKMLAAVGGNTHVCETINPKAVTTNELYGTMSRTKEWKDGVVSTIMRDMAKNQGNYKATHLNKWVCFDGDVDAGWIESMNTVMDDNKTLTLVSNERIPLSGPMRLIFEVSNLRNASPATVSRAGMLFINDIDIGMKPFMDSWLDTIENDIAKSKFYLDYQQIIEANLDEIHRYTPITPTVDIAILQSMTAILKSLISDKTFKDLMKTYNEDDQKLVYANYFIYAGIWAIGAPIGDNQKQSQFSTWWKGVAKKFPEALTVFDYYYDAEKLAWAPWIEKVEEFSGLGMDNPANIIIPTIDIVRTHYIMKLNVEQMKPAMFVGPAGTGKTTIIRDYLAGLNSEFVLNYSINFNSYTDSKALQASINGNIEKRLGRMYGPPAQKKLIFFIDDLNMPAMDEYQNQSPISLLTQLLNYKSMFDRDHLEEKHEIQDVLFMAAMNPKAGTFTIDTRCQRHFTTFAALLPGQEVLQAIYNSILSSHLSQFDNALNKLSTPMVDATIELFKNITENPEFSPSARKFHYQFNLRDISKIVIGVMQSAPSTYRGNPGMLIRLWIHECDRIYLDRLITDKDREIYNDYIRKSFKHFEGEDAEENFVENNIYTSFVSVHGGNDKAYMPIKDMPQLKACLEAKLGEYNEEKAAMDLVLFDQAMEHVCRIARIVDMPNGNALLVGVGGSGKQSLSRLASFILEFEVIQILVSQSYSANDLKTDLQEMFTKAGLKAGGIPCCFVLTDTQIVDEMFLIYINDMLSSGYVQDLFPKEDLDGLLGGIRNEAKGAGYLDTPDQLFEYFVNKVKANLHVILCFSPVSEMFRIRARKFPALISCTTIDWFHPWPRDALIDVASRFLEAIDFSSDELRDNIALHMAEVHLSIDDANKQFLQIERRFNYTTPKSFLELIDFYKKLLSIKRGKVEVNIEKLETGLDTLQITQSKVQGLKDDLDVKMVEVGEKQRDTNALIEKVTAAQEIANKEMEDANKEEETTNEAASKANEIQVQADAELEEALPAMEAAKKAVDCLTKASISEMKALANPPGAVVETMKAVLIMRGEKRNYAWGNGQKVLNNPAKFMEELLDYNKEEIADWIINDLQPIIANPTFNEADMRGKSVAASYICAWVVNVIKYNGVYKKVKPLMETLDSAKLEVETKTSELAVVRARVKDANDKVAAMNKELSEATELKERVEAEANVCLTKLSMAERLVNGLADENTRWGLNVQQLKIDAETTTGDTLLAGAFVSYIGPFSARIRNQLWSEIWLPDIKNKQIPFTEGVDPLKVLASDADEAHWKNEGLPADRMSLENAGIITSCSRWPLIIDPQLQGSSWIRGKEGEDLEVLQLTQDRWLKRLQNCIQLGKVLLIENVGEELDATLDPVLQRAIIRKGRNSLFIKLGADEVEYDMTFKLYIMTKLANPHYRPEIAAQCTIINFIVTESGLEDQLLAMVVNVEKPELEAVKTELVRKQNEFKVTLAKLEDDLLNKLTEADQTTILENTELIEGLELTKQTAEDIKLQTIEAQENEVKINLSREVYRRVAAEGAMVYFLIIALCIVNPLYQYSLESFNTFFFKAIERTQAFDDAEQRVLTLRENIRRTIYQWISRGLFERHKIIFLTQITFRLMQKGILSTPYEGPLVNFLLKCPLRTEVEKPAVLDWLPETSWFAVQKLIDMEEFQNFGQHLEKDAPARFRDWFNDLTPETMPLPLEWKKLADHSFQKLLILRCMRPDRLTNAMTIFIRKALPDGDKFCDMDQENSFQKVLQFTLDDSTPITPIFFILSPGSNPVADAEKVGKSLGYEPGKNFHSVALGQGQDVEAMRLLEMGHKEGHWVMLQNIHLMPNWLPALEKCLDAFAAEGSNLNFRLFLSAEPGVQFPIPIGILERSIKLTNEPPSGLKANMMRAFGFFSPEDINDKDNKVKSILFGLCFFHSVVVERKKFGAKGWNSSYPFNMGDLRDSVSVLNNYLETNAGSSKIPWDDLRYIFGQIMYGGHIVDDRDRNLCMTYLAALMDNPLLNDDTELFFFADGKGAASFKTPAAANYERYIEHIETTMPAETPIAFGLHPNAEIGFRTAQADDLFKTLLDLQPKDAGGGDEEDGATRSKNEIASEVVSMIIDDMNIETLRFDIEDIRGRVNESDEKLCYINVFLQECEYMNILLIAITTSLKEIALALKGELTATDQMEAIIDNLVLERVPASWQALAYPSSRGLSSWLTNLEARFEQLKGWQEDPAVMPKIINIARLFNPQSYLTAIKQYTAQRMQWELNKLYIVTDVTKRYETEIEGAAREGAYVTGVNLDGARWDVTNNQLEESKPKEMFFILPVVNCKAAIVPPEGKEDKNVYQCPSYRTVDRGATYVFTAQLRTPRFPPAKWVLAGVAIIMDVEGYGEPAKKQ